MKKALALLLALVMCLSLAACGGESKPTNGNNEENSSTEPQENGGNSISVETAILGAWSMEGTIDVFVFSDDGKVARSGEQYDWWYDKEAEKYFMSFKGLTFTFGIEEDENGRFITLDGVRFCYVENYDPGALEAEYIKEQVATLTEGRTELAVGNTYTTESGIEFAFEKAEIAEGDTCQLHLYIASENELDFENVQYNSFSSQSRFGIGAPYGKDGNTRIYAGGFMSMSTLETDKDKYGFLLFKIDGINYYVSISTFFE